MKKAILISILGGVLVGCQPAASPSKTPATTVAPTQTPLARATATATPSVGTTASPAAADGAFSKQLELQGVTFTVESANSASGNKVTVTPAGLEADNATQTTDIEGTVTGAEVSDLDVDGFPEVYVYVRGTSEGAPGRLVAFASNKGKSLSIISLPAASEIAEVKDSYRGGDEFAVLEARIGQRFPAVGPDGKPTGKTKQIDWKLVPGEATWQLEVDKVSEY